jgi:hypothetical protein
MVSRSLLMQFVLLIAIRMQMLLRLFVATTQLLAFTLSPRAISSLCLPLRRHATLLV